MKLNDLFDQELYLEMQREGYVRLQVHPDEPYTIVNYTEKAAWEHKWNDVTRACRGLIYNYQTGDVVARPFDKFFNYEEVISDLPPNIMGELVEVTDKQDGSLGILYPRTDGTYAVATRGSFTSDQAKHATRVLNDRYMYGANYDPGITYLVEIIYPENRIVLNYGDMDDLVMLGAVVIDDGLQLGPHQAAYLSCWKGPMTMVFPAVNFAAALAMPPRENAEGIVVHFVNTGERVKLKQADYVALHRIVTGMSDRVIWELLGAGQTVPQIKEPLPEEFHPWVDQVVDDLYTQSWAIHEEVWKEFDRVMWRMPVDFTRKDFALSVMGSPNRKYLFMYLDGNPIFDVVWKSIKPEAGRSMTTQTSEES